MSTTANHTTTLINNHDCNQNKQYTEIISNNIDQATMKTTDTANNGRETRRDRKKGEGEKREDNVKRTSTMKEHERERAKQTIHNTDLVTSFTTNLYNCPSVDDSITNRVTSSFNSNNNLQTFNSMNRHFREYEPSYPSITRYGTSSCRKRHYLDDYDEEILHEEILEIIHLNHYPTLIERWGDDTKIIVRQEGDLQIEDYVEFEEIEPTIVEEILYEFVYSGDQIESYKEIHHSRAESRNFRKIRKRRTKRKRQEHDNLRSYTNTIDVDNRATELLDEMHNLSNQIDLIIQTNEEISKLHDESSSDEQEISMENIVTKELNQTYETIPSVINGDHSSDIDLIVADTSFSENDKISLQSLMSDGQQETEQSSDQDLHLFLNSLLEYLIPESLDENDQCFISKIKSIEESTSDGCFPSDQIETMDEIKIQRIEHQLEKIIEITDNIEKPSTDSHMEIEEKLTNNSIITPVKQETFEDIHEVISTQNASFDLPTTVDKEQSDVETIITIPEIKEDTTSEEHRFPIDDTITKDEAEGLSFNAFIDPVPEVLATSPTLYHSTRATTQMEKKVEKPSVDHLIKTLEQTKAFISSSTEIEDNQLSQSSNITSDDAIEHLLTEAVCEILPTPVNTPLPLPEVTYTEEWKDEKSSINLTAEADTQSEPEEECIEQVDTSENELSTIRSIIQTIETAMPNDQQPLIPLETQENKNIPLSSDSLADTVRQILVATLSTHLPSVDHEIKTIIQVEKSSGTPSTEINEETKISSNETKAERLSSNSSSDPVYSTSELTNINLSNKTSSELPHPNEDEISTPSQPDFREFDLHRYFPSMIIEATLFDPTDNEKMIPDSSKIYYELQEQRHIQSLLIYEQTEKKQDSPNISLLNNINLESFSFISNLPSREYRQVFGVIDETVNTNDDSTYHIDQQLIVLNEIKPITFDSDEKSQIIEASVDQQELIDITSDNISNIELDFRYSSLLNRMDNLMQPSIIENESIPSVIKENNNDKHRYLHERYDILIDHINRLGEAINSSLTVDGTNTDQQVIESQDEKTTLIPSDLSKNKSNIISIQHKKPSFREKISNVKESLQHLIENIRLNTSMNDQEDIISPTSNADDVYCTYNQPIEKIIETNNETISTSKDLTETNQSIIKTQQQENITNNTDEYQDSVEETSSLRVAVNNTVPVSTDLNSQDYSVEDQNIETTLNLPEESVDSTQQSENIYDEKMISEQEQSTRAEGQSTSDVRYTRQYQIGDAESDRLSSIQQSTTNNLNQQLQVIGDDYPWYLSYYNIVDAEMNISRLYPRLNNIIEQSSLPTTVGYQPKSHITSDSDHQVSLDTKDVHEKPDELQFMQHQKRLSSLITYETTSLPITIITNPTLSPDPNQEQLDVSIPLDNTTIKKKHKKKKVKKEMIVFDAPVSSHIDPTSAEVKHEVEKLHLIPTVIFDGQQFEIPSTSIISNAKELNPIDDKKNEALSLLSTAVTTFSQDVKIDDQPIEQITTSKKKRNKHKKETLSSSTTDWSKVTDEETILQSPVSVSHIVNDANVDSKPIRKTGTVAATPDNNEEEDNEGFQVVHYRKHIISTARSKETLTPSSAKQNLNRNIDRKTIPIPGSLNSASRSLPRTTASSQTPSNKNKQNRKQTSFFSISPRSVSTETKIIEQLQSTLDEYQTPLKDTERKVIIDVKAELDHSSQVKEYHAPIKHEIKGADQQLSIMTSVTIDTTAVDTVKLTLVEDDDDGFQVVRHRKHIPSSKTSPTSKQQSPNLTINQKPIGTYANNNSSTSIISTKKKSKNTHASDPSQSTDILSSPTAHTDLIPLSSKNEITHQTQQVPESHIIIVPRSDEVIPINTTHEIIIPPVNEPTQRTDNIKSTTPASTIIKKSSKRESTKSEASLPSNECSDKVNVLPSIESINHSSSIINVENEQIKTKKSVKRSKKNSRTKEQQQQQQDSISNSSTSQSSLETSLPQPSSIKLPSEESTSLTSQQLTTEINKQTTKTVPLSSNHCVDISTTLPLHSSQEKQSYDAINSKLDSFLPEYIRQPLNTKTSSDIIPKKKQRPKMLNKDNEARTLLTNEFDDITNIEEKYKQQIISDDDNSIGDDDIFIVNIPDKLKDEQLYSSPLIHSDILYKPEDRSSDSIDNILSRGFYHWLQESQALSQQKDNSLTSGDLTRAMQSIVIQPIENNEDSWNELQVLKPTYMFGIRSEKRIHSTNAYLVNHSESISASSWFMNQSNNNTLQDDPSKFDEDSNDDTSKKQNSQPVNRQLSTKKTDVNHDNNQQCFDEEFSGQSLAIIQTYPVQINSTASNKLVLKEKDHQSIHFDDWAYFFDHDNSDHTFLSTPFECFYAQSFDEDTFISDSKPIHHSIKHKTHRYGDFSLSTDDIIRSESTIHFPLFSSNQEQQLSYRSKPSKSFQRWRSQTSIQFQNDDDEIFLSHSNSGLNRRVKL